MKSVETYKNVKQKFTIKKCWNFTKKLREFKNQKCWNFTKSWENFTIKSVETLQWNWGKNFPIKRVKNFQNIEPNFTTKNVWLNFMFDKVNKSKIKVSFNVTIPIWTLFESYPKGIVKRISSHPKLTSLWAMSLINWTRLNSKTLNLQSI